MALMTTPECWKTRRMVAWTAGVSGGIGQSSTLGHFHVFLRARWSPTPTLMERARMGWEFSATSSKGAYPKIPSASSRPLTVIANRELGWQLNALSGNGMAARAGESRAF